MKLLAITDLHGELHALEEFLAQAPPVSAILLGGDLTNFGSGEDAAEIVARCREFSPEVLAVAGNCDAPEIERRLVTIGASVFRRGRVIGPIGVYGLSAMPVWHRTMYELTEEQIALALNEGRSDLGERELEVILSHPPPRGAVDRTRRWEEVGSTSLREHIETWEPALVICGHIHEARGTAYIGSTLIVNCGAGFAGEYAVIEIQPDGQIHVELREA